MWISVNNKTKIIVGFIFLSLLFTFHACAVSAGPGLKAGDTWMFELTTESSIRMPGEPEVSSYTRTSSTVRIDNITGTGDNERIVYTVISSTGKDNYPANRMNSYVGLYCYASNYDNDGYLDSFYVSGGGGTFVNPDWSANASRWENSVASAAAESSLISVLEKSASGGKFHVKLQAKYDYDYNGDYINDNATRTVTIDLEVDSDGVLLSSTQVDRSEYDDGAVATSTTKMVRVGGTNLLLYLAVGGVVLTVAAVLYRLIKRRGRDEWDYEEKAAREEKEKSSSELEIPAIR